MTLQYSSSLFKCYFISKIHCCSYYCIYIHVRCHFIFYLSIYLILYFSSFLFFILFHFIFSGKISQIIFFVFSINFLFICLQEFSLFPKILLSPFKIKYRLYNFNYFHRFFCCLYYFRNITVSHRGLIKS